MEAGLATPPDRHAKSYRRCLCMGYPGSDRETVKVKLHNVAYWLYRCSRRAIRLIGLTKTVRGVLGPIGERLIWRLASGPEQQFTVQGHRMVLASGDGRPAVGMVTDVYEEGTTRLF